MYDELLKALRGFEDYDGLDFLENRTYAQDIAREAADAIEELSREKESLEKDVEIASYVMARRWIPVTERLPECEGERVLVAANFLTSYLRVSICYFSKNLEDVDKYDFDGKKRSGFYAHDPEYGYYERQCVRYWMPLPQPPEEERE